MTYTEGRDAIYSVFIAVWGVRPVIWNDISSRVPDETNPWARATIRHTSGGQGSLSNDVGTKQFKRQGILLLQIFAPAGQGQAQSYQLATMVANAYEDAKLDVWFRNIRIKEQGTSGASDQIDVLADFSYDEVR